MCVCVHVCAYSVFFLAEKLWYRALGSAGMKHLREKNAIWTQALKVLFQNQRMHLLIISAIA